MESNFVSMFSHIHSSCMPSKCRDGVEIGVSLANAQVGAVGTVIGMRTGVSPDTMESDTYDCDLAGWILAGCGRAVLGLSSLVEKGGKGIQNRVTGLNRDAEARSEWPNVCDEKSAV